jgi:hypothetical protein
MKDKEEKIHLKILLGVFLIYIWIAALLVVGGIFND